MFSVVHDYFELRPTKPRLKVLRQMLDENPYSGEECEEDEEHNGKKVSSWPLMSSLQHIGHLK